ncbi:MAG: transporter [Betaproteobacteria bacterium]|nr:transporter [Betaproteobacteria bacterium]
MDHRACNALRRGLRRAIAAGLAVASFSLGGAAQAQVYPSKQITLVVPYSAGGGVDVIARLVGAALAERLGQAVVIDNRPGVSGIIGAQYVAHAAPDGYTLLAGNTTTNVTNQFLTKNPGYHGEKDFTPVALLDTVPVVLVVPANSRFNSVGDIIAAARAAPDALNYGSSGNGSSHHLAAQLFQSMTKTKLRHIPYKGSSNVMTDLVGGQIDMAFEVVPAAAPLVQSKRLKALGVSTKFELPALPGIKPIAESLPGYDMQTWHGVFAPAGTPSAVVERLGRELVAIVALPATQKRMQELGVIADGRAGAAFAKYQHEDIVRWGTVIREAGIQPD